MNSRRIYQKIMVLCYLAVLAGATVSCKCASCSEGLSESTSLANEEILYKQAERLFDSLKSWQESEDWENFFLNKDEYQEAIENKLSRIKQSSFLLLRAKYLLWKTQSLFDLKSAREAFLDFLTYLKSISEPGKEVILFTERIIQELSVNDKPVLKAKIASVYKDMLMSSASAERLKKEADRFFDQGDTDNAVSLYRNYLRLLNKKGPDYKNELILLLQKTIDTGFGLSSAAGFAEDLFKILETADSDYSGREEMLYFRGYNLERLSLYSQACLYYKQILNAFPDTRLRDELNFRIGYLNAYKLKNNSFAEKYLLQVENNDLYPLHNTLQSLRDNLPQEYNSRLFFEALLGIKKTLGSNFLDIDASAHKVFINSQVKVKAASYSPDTGCLVPQGLYLWSGSLGTAVITTNTPVFSTSFKTTGGKIINVVEESPGGILGQDSVLLDVYSLDIFPGRAEFRTGEQVNFKYKLFPYLPRGSITAHWKLEGPVSREFQGPEFLAEFSNPGRYKLSVSLSCLDKEIFSMSKGLEVK